MPTKTETKHTPTPWHYKERCAYGNDLYYGDDWLGYTISTVTGEDIAEYNAAFIVRACNGWENKEALRARLAELEAQDATL